MTDLVHWRERACGEQEPHAPHAYFAGETYVCRGVTQQEYAWLALVRLGESIRTAVLPALERTAVAISAWDAAMRKRRDSAPRGDADAATVYACCGADAPGPHHEGCDAEGW